MRRRRPSIFMTRGSKGTLYLEAADHDEARERHAAYYGIKPTLALKVLKLAILWADRQEPMP